MKVALVFAGASAARSMFLPYRSRRFTKGLAAEGFDPVLIDLDIAETSRFAAVAHDAPDLRYYRNRVDRLPLILQQERPSVVQTFGPTSGLAPVWRAGAKAGVPLVHFVGSEEGMPVRRPAVRTGLTRATPRLPALWNARLASRKVTGLIGSNRADLGRHLRHRFFPRAKLSLVAPPPIAALSREVAPRRAAGAPVFGMFDPDASECAMRFLCHALDLAASTAPIEVRISPAALGARSPARDAGIAFVDAEPDELLRSIDVLLVPEASDRTAPVIAAALAAQRIVVVPDTGTAIELVDYGRHGVLYTAGSAYHLALAINVVTQSWANRVISFNSIDAVLAKATPEAVAHVFARAYRQLRGTA